MTTTTLSAKFQIVIPKEIRNSMKLKPGQRLQFTVVDGKIEVRPVLRGDQLIGFLKGEAALDLEREKTDRALP